MGGEVAKAADDLGLARARFARELDEPAGLVDAVEQVRERLGVPLAEVQEAGFRRDRERLFLEPEKARIRAGSGPSPAHRASLTMPARGGHD